MALFVKPLCSQLFYHLTFFCFWDQSGSKKKFTYDTYLLYLNNAQMSLSCLFSYFILLFKKKNPPAARSVIVISRFANMEAAVTRWWEGGMLMLITLFSWPVDHDRVSPYKRGGGTELSHVYSANIQIRERFSLFPSILPVVHHSNAAWVHRLVM